MNFLQKNKGFKIIDKYQVLFVCTGNSCRSPMAEGILKKIIPENYQDKINVYSAGTGGFLNVPATYLAIEVARENGVDIQHHLSQGITNYLMQKTNLVLAMAKDHEKYLSHYFPGNKENIYLLKTFALENKKKAYVNIDDPIGQNKKFYTKIYQEIESELKRILPEILKRVDIHFEND